MISIAPLPPERLEDFFSYLAAHVSENGQDGSLLFLPLSRPQSTLSPEMKSKFERGMHLAYGEAGWRKTWAAATPENRIVGHIDLRAHPQPNAEHRVLLGMGVDRNFRGMRIGRRLLEVVAEYARNHPGISWIDLEVLTHNLPARRLYEAMGFVEVGVTRDMFRIGGQSYDYTSMTLQVGA